MTSTFRTALMLAGAGFAAACTKSDMEIKTSSAAEVSTSESAKVADVRGVSLVRVVNAVDGGTDIAVKLDGQMLFGEVEPAAVTDYREVAVNLAQFTVNVQGVTDGMMLAEKDRLLLDGQRYTVFLVAEDSGRTSLRVVNDKVIPDSGRARIRVLHAAPKAGELDISIAGSTSKLFAGVNFKSEAGYADVVPGKVTLEVRGKDESRVRLRIADLDLRRSTATTIVLSGTGKLQSFMFTDAMVAPVAWTKP
jgi:hypothetical protein